MFEIQSAYVQGQVSLTTALEGSSPPALVRMTDSMCLVHIVLYMTVHQRNPSTHSTVKLNIAGLKYKSGLFWLVLRVLYQNSLECR